jgi:putative membrane protein
MNWLKDKFKLSLALLVIVYLVGTATVLAGYPDQLMKLTSYNLLFVAFLFLYNASEVNKTYTLWLLIIGISGYLVELLGILTGLVFGTYSYGEGLGIKVADVPLMIGVNWALLVFATGALIHKIRMSLWLRAALGATVMVGYDVLLEPVAMRFDFWSWEGNQVPLQNYLAWWIISFVMHFGVMAKVNNLQNRLALPVIIIQMLFFVLLLLTEELRLF